MVLFKSLEATLKYKYKDNYLYYNTRMTAGFISFSSDINLFI